ncbi:MAG: FAD-binding protein [Flavobacteriaceae bacterium]
MNQAIRWDEEVDLLVAGAGCGGMTAALVGALEGLDVLICEKTGKVGGTTSRAAGTLWIPGNSQNRDAGYPDSVEAAAGYLQALIGDRGLDIRKAYLESGPAVIDDIAARTDVRFLPCIKHPDYVVEPGAAVTGRAIMPEPFDGRLLGDDFERVRAPIGEFMLLGGMMVGKMDIIHLLNRFRSRASFMHSLKLVLRYFRDRLRYSRGTRLVMGNALVARLFYSLRKRDVPIRFESSIAELIVEDGAVTGAAFDTPEGRRHIRARNGVVLATGGIAHDTELWREFMPVQPTHSIVCESVRGEGLKVARRAGAVADDDDHRGGALWQPVSVTPPRKGWSGLFAHLYLDRAKPGLIAIDSTGKRFGNEADSYHHFSQAMLDNKAWSPSNPCYLICSAEFVEKWGLGAIHPRTRNLKPFVDSGYITMAPTLAGLAAKLKIDPAALEATVARFNGFARAGVDEDFHRGESELNRFNGDPDHRPNPSLGPVEGSAFVALPVWPAECASSAGLKTNADAQVMNGQGEPISGLYACGNDMASLLKGAYPGPGATLGPAVVFGYRAAMHARRRRMDNQRAEAAAG